MRVLHAWLCVQLHERGFRVETEPGAAIRLTRDGDSFDPEGTIRALAEDRMSAREAMRQLCQKWPLEMALPAIVPVAG